MIVLPLNKTRKNNLTKLSKKRSKLEGISLSQAREILCIESGFKSYHDVRSQSKALENNTLSSVNLEIEKIKSTAQALLLSVTDDPNFGNRNPNFKQHLTVEIHKSIYLDVFNDGVIHSTPYFDDIYFSLSNAMGNETFNDNESYNKILVNDADIVLNGMLSVAISHFFRSVQRCLTDARKNHPNFEIYFTHWIYSVDFLDNISKPLPLLYDAFPKPSSLKVGNGTTTWFY